MKKNKKKMTIGIEDYIKANKKLAREEELARNGGRWVAKERAHKNLKKYDRKRDKKNFDSYLSFFVLLPEIPYMLHQKVPLVNFLMTLPKFFPLSINKEHLTSLFALIKLFIYENRNRFCPADN